MFIVKRYNQEILSEKETKLEAIEEILNKYDFKVEEITNDEVVEFEGNRVLKSRADEIEKLRQEQKEANFNKDFFNTSLGYVRRKVTMAGTGETESFLSDILPLLEVGIPIIVYTYLAKEQKQAKVTEQFIEECKQQKLKDFYPIGEENV